MPQIISITGFVGTVPESSRTARGDIITRFRLGCPQSYFDKKTQRWIDQEMSWYSVTSFRQLATNVQASISKGDRVMVTGALKITTWTGPASSGTSADLDAKSIGHDLYYGKSTFVPIAPSAAGSREQSWPPAQAHAPSDAPALAGGDPGAAPLDPDAELAQMTASLEEDQGATDIATWSAAAVAALSAGETLSEEGASEQQAPF